MVLFEPPEVGGVGQRGFGGLDRGEATAQLGSCPGVFADNRGQKAQRIPWESAAQLRFTQ